MTRSLIAASVAPNPVVIIDATDVFMPVDRESQTQHEFDAQFIGPADHCSLCLDVAISYMECGNAPEDEYHLALHTALHRGDAESIRNAIADRAYAAIVG